MEETLVRHLRRRRVQPEDAKGFVRPAWRMLARSSRSVRSTSQLPIRATRCASARLASLWRTCSSASCCWVTSVATTMRAARSRKVIGLEWMRDENDRAILAQMPPATAKSCAVRPGAAVCLKLFRHPRPARMSRTVRPRNSSREYPYCASGRGVDLEETQAFRCRRSIIGVWDAHQRACRYSILGSWRRAPFPAVCFSALTRPLASAGPAGPFRARPAPRRMARFHLSSITAQSAGVLSPGAVEKAGFRPSAGTLAGNLASRAQGKGISQRGLDFAAPLLTISQPCSPGFTPRPFTAWTLTKSRSRSTPPAATPRS